MIKEFNTVVVILDHLFPLVDVYVLLGILKNSTGTELLLWIRGLGQGNLQIR